MLLQVDTNTETRQILPSAPIAKDFADWKVKPERHDAYARLWKYSLFAGIFANTALWLYLWVKRIIFAPRELLLTLFSI